MGRRSPIRLGLALAFVLVVQHTLAGEEKCRTGCMGAPQIFKYTEGTTYKYNYEGNIDITLSTAEGQQTGTEIKALVLLTQQADCTQVLRLQNVQILGPGGKKFGQIPDIEKPIVLNFHDGHIEDSICVEGTDTQNSINVKRAIASIFQVNLKHGHETDVFGLCPTETSSHKEGNLLVVQKSRNLNACAYRENIKQDFLATTFNLNSEIKSSPILNADYNAKLKIKNGILDQATITENYLYVPFSVGKNGAKAQVTSKLHLAGTSKDNTKASANQPRSIIFENPHPVNSEKSNVNSILNAVKDTAKTIDITVGEETAKEFVNLIKILRVSKKDDILAVYNQVKAGVGFGDKAAAKKLFLDALLRAGNGNSVEVAIALLKNKELSEIEEKIVYIGLSFVRHATPEAVNSAISLLSQPNLSKSAYLGIGNLAGRFCRQHNCEKVEAINKLLQTLSAKLKDGKTNNRQEEDELINVLKAITNIHHLNDNILTKLTVIAQNKKASNRLRVTALEAYLSDPCKDKLRDSALGILQDIQQDSEVRIKAYLALAQCPNAKIGNAIKSLLENEPSYQVGGFIVSHIRNIRASANPDKELAKQHLGFLSLPTKYPVDFRKWSYNGEFSYSIDTLGISSATEANIIYSQQSFLPRSTNLNLTAEVFGHTFNFLEIETRQENLDRLIEHYFGPKGVLSNVPLSEVWKQNEKTAVNLFEHFQQKLDKTLRARRDVSKADIENIGKQVQIQSNDLNGDLDLDLSVRAFGSEVLFVNINDDVQKWTPKAIIDKVIAEFGKGLERIKKFEETLRSNILFLDAEFDYPTSLGFPLRLAVEGTSNVQVKAQGNVDVRSLLLNSDNTVKINVIPSANIEVAGRLTLDAYVVENGLKVISTLYSATGGDLTVDIFNGGTGIDVKFGLPVKEQKIISANHEIVFHTRELASREQNTPLKFAQNKDFSICFDHLSPFIGLAFCGEINGPNLSGTQVPVLPFPLAGDSKLAVHIEKEDVSQYHFRSVLTGTTGELNIETIGNGGDKKLSFQIQTSTGPEKFIKAALISPVKKASAEGRITSTDTEKSISLRATNDNDEYFGKIGVQVSGSPNKAVYKPILEVKTPAGIQKLPYNVQGQIIAEHNGGNVKYTFDNVKAILSDQKTITLKGNIGRDGQAFFTDLTLTDDVQSATLKGRLQANPNLLKFNVEAKNTLNPQANFNVKGEFKRQTGQYDSNLQIIHGQDLSSKTNILTLSHSVTKKFKTPSDFEIATKNKISYPLLNVDGKFEFEHTPKTLDYDLDVKYNEVKFGSELDSKFNQKEFGDYQIEFDLYGIDNRLELKASRQIQNEESKIDNSLVVNGKKFEVSGKVRHHVKPTNIDVGTDLTIVLPTHNTPFKVVTSLKSNPNEIDLSEKITSGGTTLVDLFLKANKAGNANGSIKIALKNILNVNGQVKANKGSGSADILFDIIASKRQVKAESTFSVQLPTTFNIDLTIYPNFNEKKDRKIILKTHNKLSPTSVDSKNNIDIVGHKLEVNVKGSRNGDVSNGKLNGEVEITLPNEHYIVGKLNFDRKTENNLVNANTQASLEHRKNKNTTGRKISWKGQTRNSNPREGILNCEHTISADNGDGKTLNYDLIVKIDKNDGVSHYDVKNKASGTVLKHPVEANVKGHCKNRVGQYEVHTSYGPNAVLSVQGKYDLLGQGTPVSGEINIDLQSPSKVVKVVKLVASGSAQKPVNPSDYLELKGSGSLFVDDDGTKPDAVIDVKGTGQLKANDKDGQISGTLNYGKQDPISIDLEYGRKEDGVNKQLNAKAAVQYGKSKNVKAGVSLTKEPGHSYKLIGELDLPTEQHKTNKIVVQTKRSEDYKHTTSHVELSSDGKLWTADSDWLLSDLTPTVDIKIKNPEGKLSSLFAKINKLGDKQVNGELKLSCEARNFLLEGALDANVENVDDFFIKLNVHSPNLKLNKINLEAHNKPGKTGRRIQITVKSGTNNLVSGSTSYTARDESGKYIVEGSGSFKVKEETKSANFKYIVQRLTTEKNGEQGIEISFDAGLGNKAIDAEFKATNKQFRILNSYCEEKKQCAHVEFDTKINSNDIHNYNQELEIAVDLRKLGLSHEFGLKAVTKRKDYVLDHTVDIHFQSPQNSKYQYSLYLHPREAGVSLTTPKRVVSLEAKADVPKQFKEGGKVSGEVVFYLDKKNHPEKKTSFNGWLDVDLKNQKINGESKFIHPGLSRPLSTSIKTVSSGTTNKGETNIIVELDIFAQPNQKIVATVKNSVNIDPKVKSDISLTWKMVSSGLGIEFEVVENTSLDLTNHKFDYEYKVKTKIGNSHTESIVSTKASQTQAYLLVKVLNSELLKVQHKYSISKNEQVIDSEFTPYRSRPVISHLEIKNWNTLKMNVGHKETPNKKLQVSSGLIPGLIADLRAEILNGGNKQGLFHATIKLDEANFLKSDYGVESKNIEALLKQIKDESTKSVKEIRNIGNSMSSVLQKDSQQLGEIAKRAMPNLKPLRDYYTAELKKIKDEILTDKTIRDITDFLKNIFGAVASAAAEIFEKLSALLESIAQAIQTSFSKVVQIIEKELIPQLKEVAEKILATAGEVLNTTTEIVLAYLTKLSKIVEQYQPEFKQIATALSEINQDLGRFVLQVYESIRSVVLEQWHKIYEEIKTLPIIEEFKAQYEEIVKNGLPNAQTLINTIREVAGTIKDVIPDTCKEGKDLIDIIVDYLEKKIKNEKVDDIATLDKIIATSSVVAKKVLKLFAADEKYDWNTKEIPLTLGFLTKLPRLVAVKFSPLSHIFKEESPGAVAFVLSLWTHPLKWIPPFQIEGIVSQRDIFTFDGKYVTFPGTCSYLLARDALNGNFSIVGTFNGGLLSSITLADKEDSITIKKGGQILLNNAAVELPTRKPNLAAFRTYTYIELVSTAGVRVLCPPSLLGCSVIVSGFYHGRLRGLLGNGNNEPFDDFTIPSGKIVTSPSEFGNSYKTSSGCGAITIPDNAKEDNVVCNKLFGWESPLRYCYPFVDNSNYKLACVRGVNAGVKDAELATVHAYVAVCNRRNIFVQTPSELLKCTNSDKPYLVGDKFSVKLPTKAADIVLLVDSRKSNEAIYKELVQPLVQEVGKSLHSKGINDVEFHLVTYGGENKWPSHITVGGKLTFKGKAPNVKFSDDPKGEKLDSVYLQKYEHLGETLRKIVYDLKLALGLHLQAQTYAEGLDYPFRANAVKTVIAVTGNPCETGYFLPLQKLRTILYKNNLIKINLITPFDGLNVKDAKKTKDVVGFNSENVFTLSQAKKKPEGSSELYKDLQYDDFCVDFTLKNKGNVFVSDNFVQAKADGKKQFVQTVAHNIVRGLTQNEDGVDCECKIVSPWRAQNICETVYSKEKAGRKT